MDTIQLDIKVEPRDPWTEILVSQLAEMGFDAFEETEQGTKAYGPAELIDMKEVLTGTWLGRGRLELEEGACQISYEQKIIPYQNWNANWESDFQEVDVEGKLRILAPFHEKKGDGTLEIEIQPRTSFGTGHHQTTWLISRELLHLDQVPSVILDMGTGTGVLAILAEKLGATEILAIDNEPWSVENAQENVARNQCEKITCQCGEEELLKGKTFEMILANINKNVLKHQLPVYASCQENGGLLMLSGFFESDVDELQSHAARYDYVFDGLSTRENWAMLRLKKN